MSYHATSIKVEYTTLGRITICELSSEKGSPIGIGAACCHPTDKNDVTLGRAIALRRALADAEHATARVVRHRTRALARG